MLQDDDYERCSSVSSLERDGHLQKTEMAFVTRIACVPVQCHKWWTSVRFIPYSLTQMLHEHVRLGARKQQGLPTMHGS